MVRKGKPSWLQEWQKENGSGNKKITNSDHAEVHRLYYEEQLPAAEIGKQFGVSLSCIQKIMKKHGWESRSRSEAFKLSHNHGKNLQNWRKRNDSWNKGLTKDDPRMASLIEKGRQTQIKNGKSKGKNNPMYGKMTHAHAGFRKDLGHYVRSSWEANFARVLIHLGITYEYEQHTFELSDESTYTPDFFLPDRKKFYEIKGWEKNDKHIRFAQEYPTKRFCVIYEKQYSRLLKRFGDFILVDDSQSRFTKKDLCKLFVQYVQENDARPNVRNFCKHIGISNKTIIRLFGSESEFKQSNESEISNIENSRLISKYIEQTLILGHLPTRREFYGFYSRAFTLMKLVFGHNKIVVLRNLAAKQT